MRWSRSPRTPATPWLLPRRTFDFSWSGLDRSELDTLLPVIAQQFKWVHPDDLAGEELALVGMGAADVRMVSSTRRFVVSLRCVQLVWIGSGV